MTAEAVTLRGRHELRKTAAAAIASGEVHQLADGRAAIYCGLNAAASGERTNWTTEGQYTVAKTSGVVVLDGAPLWWDHSANSATPVPPLTDRDFFLGCAVGDAASGDATCVVNLNVEPQYVIDLHKDGGDTAVVLTAGTPYIYNRGGTLEAGFSATAEAQKLDWLSKRSFPIGSNWILEAVLEVVTNADADVADLNVGVANETHASDADTIGESCFFHLDLGADLNLDAESDDGAGTEVAATDTTIDWAVGTPLHLVIDGRDPSDIQLYANGVLVLPATVFTLASATGPLKALFHLEKTANDSPGVVQLDMLRVRIAEQ
jgi:predicted RecA/RadA family phage recombinase